MAKIPQQYTDQPEMVNAVIEARRIQMETEDTSFAIEWLMEHYPMSLNSATRVLEDETFLYVALYPEGHPGLEPRECSRMKRSYTLLCTQRATPDSKHSEPNRGQKAGAATT